MMPVSKSGEAAFLEAKSGIPTPAWPDDATDLFRRWRGKGDVGARNQLIERHLPLARKLARRYAASADSHEDLTQVASLGLVKAVERFDPDKGFAFTSFAVPTIVGELKRYFRDAGWALHVDRSAQERARRVLDAQKRVSAAKGRAPTVPELALYLECTEEEVLDGLQTAEAHDAVSLDAPLGEGEEAGTRLESIGADDARLGRVDDEVTVFSAARHLPRREREIIYLRFHEHLTQSEIADRVGVSQMQVSRLLRRSLAKLYELTADDAAG